MLEIVPLILFCIIIVIWLWSSKPSKSRFQSFTDWGNVNAVPENFDWSLETPHKYRPFKPIYHLTMSVTRTNRQEWLKIDANYLESIDNHQRIMTEHPDSTCMVQYTHKTGLAIHEIYDFILDTLIQRYPKYFVRQGDCMENTIRSTKIPLFSTNKLAPEKWLQMLVDTIQEDVFVLEYDPEVQEYRLRATTGIAGLGFEWRTKVGLKLSDIHGPVPGYPEKLQKSMNKYFHKITPGNFTQRVTYGLMLGEARDLFSSGNFSFKDGGVDISQLDFEHKVFVRLERQVLFRLPVSSFLGFTIRTYLYSLAELKKEGLGDACADALEAWPEDTAYYKGRHLWGDAVFSYLRS